MGHIGLKYGGGRRGCGSFALMMKIKCGKKREDDEKSVHILAPAPSIHDILDSGSTRDGAKNRRVANSDEHKAA